MISEKSIAEEYKKAKKFARDHYENFPVASVFIKKELRKHVAIIYKFARQADDIADEGQMEANERLHKLNEYENNFLSAVKGKAEAPFWTAVSFTVNSRKLNAENFIKLLQAFKHDVVINRYETFDNILDYCKLSANPVGRLILELHGITDERAKWYSDDICTGLQIANFYQDISVDIQKDRIYIPLEEIKKAGLSENTFDKKENYDKFESLLKYQVERARGYFLRGRGLLGYLNGLLKYQIAFTILGGEEILNKIAENNYNTLALRPTLSKSDLIKIVVKAWKL